MKDCYDVCDISVGRLGKYLLKIVITMTKSNFTIEKNLFLNFIH
jgi:hypothetical protein